MLSTARTTSTLIAVALTACDSSSSAHHGADATSNSAGSVGIGQLVAAAEIDWTAGAVFGASATSTPSSCTRDTSSGCEVQMCGPLGPDGGIPPDPDVGVITFSGGAITTPIALTPDAGGHYSQVNGTGRIFTAGDAISVSAAGGDIPAFSSAVTAPADIVVTAPSLSNTETPISGAQDLTFTWTGGTVGSVWLELLWNPTSMSSQAVVCRFPATAGTGAIPKAQLPGAGMTGRIVVVPTNVIDVSAGSTSVDCGVTATRLLGRFAVQ